jgi:iron complex outermembrane receptor protein
MSPDLCCKSVLLFVLIFLSFTNLHSQDISVTLKVVNEKQQPVSSATLTIVNRADTLKVYKEVTDTLGVATVRLAKGQQYILSISSINYQPFEKGILIGNQSSFTFSLINASKTLGGVVVRSSKPLMHQEDDKTIVEPENLVAASTNGYEVLEKIPGLFVDQDGNIYIASTTPASVLINGRELKMSTADIATLLKSLPPNAIQSIEIVRTPSAKYDASGSGGVVNVILKKGIKLGMTGSVNGGFQQGMYGNQYAGFSLNNNDGRKSSYINVNVGNRNNYERINTDRIFAPDTMLAQRSFTKYSSQNYFTSYGLTYGLSKKWDLDFAGSFSYTDFDNNSENINSIQKISTGQTLTNNLNRVRNKGNAIFFNNGLEAKMKIDSLGSEWVNDVYYSYVSNKSNQGFTTSYGAANPESGGDGTNNNNRGLLNARSDLKLIMKHKLTLEAGLKSSFLAFNSVADYYRDQSGIREKDPVRTNTFNYDENINSVYVQASKTVISDLVIKAGVRVENTNMKGHQTIPGDTTFEIHRTDPFPYVYISKKVVSIAGFELRSYLVFRRTITRPVYEQLNPFPRYVDEYLSEVGNPTLRPQFNNNYEFNISVNETPLLAVGLNKTKDIFTNVIYQSDSIRAQAFRTYDNLGSNEEFYVRGLGAIPPGGRYFFVVGGQYNHNFYQGLYENKPLSYKKGSWTFFTYHTFKIDKLSVITMNGFVRLKGQLQFYELSTFGALNMSVNRQFMKRKLIVTVSANDIFKTNKNEFTINQGSVNASGARFGDTQRFGINFRYNFGMKKRDDSNNMFNVESPEKSQ